MTPPKINVLMVCMGNICRSPLAEAVFRQHVASQNLQHLIHVDSAGTHGYHVNCPPDRRAQRIAENYGIDISALRSRQVSETDFETFDYIISMDHFNLECLEEVRPASFDGELRLFLSHSEDQVDEEIPDPYYGNLEDFIKVYELTKFASIGLLQHIRRKHKLA